MASGNTYFMGPSKAASYRTTSAPTSTTDITSFNSQIFQIVAANNTGGALTLLVKDNASTAFVLIPTVSIPANSVMLADFPEGVYMSGGIDVTASGANLMLAIQYTTKSS